MSEFVPGTQEELGGFLTDAANGVCFTAGGGGAGPGGTLIRLDRLSRIIDYPARDMTITVEAGLTVAELQATLEQERQQLPIEVPEPASTSVGEAVAMNFSGPRRFGYGTLRDYVIGISAVDARGERFSAGGRVVKNVAGYDLCKLLTGSRETLAIITQLTFKLKPRPESCRLVRAAFAEYAELDLVLDYLLTSETRPTLLEVMTPRRHRLLFPEMADRATGPMLCLGYEGSPRETIWQVEQALRELQPFQPVLLESCEPGWLPRLQSVLAAPEHPRAVQFRANLPPSRTLALLEQCEQAGIAAQAHAGNGLVIGHWVPVDAMAAGAMLDRLRSFCREGQGNLIVSHCPADWHGQLPLWGEPEPAWERMRQLKQTLDPQRRLNPGRFLNW